MRPRTIALVAAMWLLGAAAFAGFAWLIQWGQGTPVEVPAAASVPPAVGPDQPLAALSAGVARTAGAAAYHLEHDERSKASHAIDAGHRAAEVGHEASHGEVKKAFAVALHELDKARQSLHNGRPASTVEDLHAVVDRLAPVVDTAKEQSPGVPPAEVWSGYGGAVLLDANGSMIGQVQRLDRDGGTTTARLRVGGANDVLIIMDFGGEQVTVPADTILWGPRRSVGSVYAVLPVEGKEAALRLAASS